MFLYKIIFTSTLNFYTDCQKNEIIVSQSLLSSFCLLQKIFFPSGVVDPVKVFALLSVLATLPADRRSRSRFGSALPELTVEVLLLVIQTGSFLLYETIKKIITTCTYLASHTDALDFASSLPHLDHANTCIFWTSFPLSDLGTLLVVFRIAMEALEELLNVEQDQVFYAYAIKIVVLSVVAIVGVSVVCVISFVVASAVAVNETVACLEI